MAPSAIAIIFFLPLPFFIFVLAIIVLLGHWEWTKFVPTSSRLSAMIIPVLMLIGSAFALPVSQHGLVEPWLGGSAITLLGAFWWLCLLFMVISYPKAISWWSNSALLQQLFGVLTLLPFLWSVLLLRSYQYEQHPYLGAQLLLMVCLLVWAADTGAYFVGKKFGQRKMAPFVSPNKTVEGLFGGLVASMLVAVMVSHALMIPFSSVPVLLLVAFITSFASVLGDLAESMFKRAAGVKDSGCILPGHGGILDRIDSLTAAFPVFTVLYFGFAQ